MANKVKKLQHALRSEDPLRKIRDLLAETNEEQAVVMWVYSCMQETDAAGIAIVFDRFEYEEVKTMQQYLKRIGATKTLSAIEKIENKYRELLDGDMSRDNILTRLDTSEIEVFLRLIDERVDDYLQEMETKLLEFCRANLEKLAEE